MTREEMLRQACKEVGFVRLRGRDGPYYVTDGNPFEDGGAWQLHEDHPALPAYVAELLVAKAMPRDVAHHLTTWAYGEVRFDYDDVADALMSAPAMTRILASMVALGHTTIEQARGVE